MLYRQRDSTVWWTQFKHAGRRYRLSTGCRAKAQAAVEARRLRAEIEANNGPGGRQGVTLAVLEELHIERIRHKGLQPRRVDDVTNMWNHLEKILGEHRDVSTLTAADIESYEGARRSEGAKGQTIRRETQALKLGIKLARRERLIRHDPIEWDDLDPIESDDPDEKKSGKTWPLKTVWAVLDALSAKAKTAGYRDMLALIVTTGLRLEEFRRIRPEWVRPAPEGSGAKAVLSLPANATKTGKPRVLPLDKANVETIEKWSDKFATKKFNHALRIASEKVGLPMSVTPRDLRTTYLTTAAGPDPVAAQRLAGHSNIATTGLYLKADDMRALTAGIAASGAIGRGHRRNKAKKKCN